MPSSPKNDKNEECFQSNKETKITPTVIRLCPNTTINLALPSPLTFLPTAQSEQT